MTAAHIKLDRFTNYRMIGKLIGANMNVTTDNIVPLTSQAGLFIFDRIIVTNPSISLTTAVGGVYTAATKGGTALVANSQVYSALTAAAKFVALTLANSALTDVFDSSVQTSVFLNLTTAQGAAATADIYVYGRTLQGNAGE